MRFLTAVALLVSLAACSQTQHRIVPASVSEQKIRAEVEQRVEGYFQAIRDLDIEYMVGFWADVEGFTVAGDGELVVGYEPWAEQLRGLIGGVSKVNYIESAPPRIMVLGPDAASFSMKYRWSMEMKDGSVVNAEGSWMFVFKRFPEGWRVVHSAGTHHYS